MTTRCKAQALSLRTITKSDRYMYFAGKPEYAFGHALSYTTFDYGNLKLSSHQISSHGQVTVQVDVKNTGQRAGDEVVQLYVHDGDAGVPRPKEQLAGFERIRRTIFGKGAVLDSDLSKLVPSNC